MAKSMADVLAHFPLETASVPYGNGHINDTYTTQGAKRYILQRINTKIFKDPYKLMENIVAVCDHVRAKVIAEGGDPERESLTVIKTKSGKLCHTTAEGDVFRVYNFIEDSLSYDVPENAEQLYHVGVKHSANSSASFPTSLLKLLLKPFLIFTIQFSEFKI